MKLDFRFQAAADSLRSTGLLEGHQHGGAHLREPFPLFRRVFGDSASKRVRFWKQCHMHAFALALRFRQILPDLLGRKNKDGRGQANQRAADLPHRGLRRAPRFISGRLGVQAILQNVEIESAEIHDAVIVDSMVDAVEFVIRVPFTAFLEELGGAVEHPAIDFLELLVRKHVA